MNGSGLTFVLTHIDVNCDSPIEIISEHFFRKASPQEIIEIKKMLDVHDISFGKTVGLKISSIIPYDSIIKETRFDNSTRYEREELPSEKWKYWVVAFEGSNSKIHKLQHAANLIKNDLDFAFELYYPENQQEGGLMGWSSMPTHLREHLSSHKAANSNAIRMQKEEIIKIGEVYKLHKNLSPEYQYIDHSIKNFNSLKTIPRNSELLTIGYFSIIEALITHAPRLHESLDSISHQIKNKLILLRKRFERKVEYNSYFLDTEEKTIWALLYGYRSCIAHGGIPDFKKKFRSLKSKEEVLDFLKEIIKCLILYSLKEPELMADFKNC